MRSLSALRPVKSREIDETAQVTLRDGTCATPIRQLRDGRTLCRQFVKLGNANQYTYLAVQLSGHHAAGEAVRANGSAAAAEALDDFLLL